MDEFEQFLGQQPVRSLPASWRREILTPTATQEAQAPWWHQWLWPSPVAWAALAVVWMVIIGLQLAARPSAEEIVQQPSTAPADIAVALAQQQRLLTELTAPEPPRRRSPEEPGPHSELILKTEET